LEVLKMKSSSIPMLPAKNFVFPVLRPLMTMIKCLKAMMQFEEGEPPPVVLKRECISNAGYLSETLTELCKRAGINGGECELILLNLKHPSLWNSHPVDTGPFVTLLEALESFSVKNKAALGEAYRQDKEYFNGLYKERVLKRRVLIVHSKNDSPDVLVKNLDTGAYYEVDTLSMDETFEKSEKHHVTVFLCTDSKQATDFFLRKDRIKIDLFLSNLGREIPTLNMHLCRIVNQAQRGGMKFLAPPFVTMKLLPAIEEAYIGHLIAFDRAIAAQERAMAEEEESLFKGMAEAELYAELIVEAHWMKTAGYAMEKSFLEAGK
jgi:hypothetical protein